MKSRLFLVYDYVQKFASKWSAKPYRSGMDKSELSKQFRKKGFEPIFASYPEITKQSLNSNDFVLYTSSEDHDLYYKSYIEDIIFGLELNSINVMPSYKFLRAHHNKVFMEILRNTYLSDVSPEMNSIPFGTLEELIKYKELISGYPLVIKASAGATGKLVSKANNFSELVKIAKKFSATPNHKSDLWDIGRKFKHKDYKIRSRHRKKFVVQNFIPGLPKDFKILIFNNKYYVIERQNRPNDFRASGSGIISYPETIPEGLLQFSKNIYKRFSLPFISLDIACKKSKFILLEFQAINFGTHALDTSPYFYENKHGNEFTKHYQKSILEHVFVEAVYEFIQNNYTL